MSAGDFFGEQALLNRAAVRGATIQAIEPTETLVVGRGEFEELRQQHPEVDRLLIGVLVAMVDRLTRQVAELTDVPATVRIYRRIVALAEVYAHEAGAAAAPIEIPLTQDQLAGLAGVHLRLTSRVLGEARAEGLLDTSKRRLVVRDLEGLRQRAELGPSGQGAGR
jgi:CRP-like cAMP-binding protein